MQICAVRSKTARRNRILRNAAAVAIAGTFAGTQADAAVTYTLMLQGGTTWSDSVWMPLDQPVPTNNPGDIVQLSAFSGASRTLDVDVTIGQLYNNLDVNFTLTASLDNNTLTMDNTGGISNPLGYTTAFLGTTGTGQLNLRAPVVLDGDLDIGATGSGPVEVGLNASITGSGNILLRSTGSARVTLRNVNHTGQIINSSTASNQVWLYELGSNVTGIVQDSATSVMRFEAGNPDFSGTLTVKRGTVEVRQSQALGTGTTILGDASTNADVTLAISGVAHPNPIVVAKDNTGKVTLTNVLGDVAVFSGTITLDHHDVTISKASASSNVRLSGSVIGDGNVLLENLSVNSSNATGAVFNHTGAIINTGSAVSGSPARLAGTIGANVTSIIQENPGTTLQVSSGNPNFAGSVVVKAGTFEFTHWQALTAKNTVVINTKVASWRWMVVRER